MYKSKVFASQIVCISRDPSVQYKTGAAQNEIELIENGAMIVNTDGTIEAVGPADEINEQYKDASFEETLDFTGQSIVPGLVDAVRLNLIPTFFHSFIDL